MSFCRRVRPQSRRRLLGRHGQASRPVPASSPRSASAINIHPNRGFERSQEPSVRSDEVDGEVKMIIGKRMAGARPRRVRVPAWRIRGARYRSVSRRPFHGREGAVVTSVGIAAIRPCGSGCRALQSDGLRTDQTSNHNRCSSGWRNRSRLNSLSKFKSSGSSMKARLRGASPRSIRESCEADRPQRCERSRRLSPSSLRPSRRSPPRANLRSARG